jgi:4-hydroxymandelate oxidase
MGGHALIHPEAELATVRGAGAADARLVISTRASLPVEDIAKAASNPVWFQLYVEEDREVTRDLVQRAEGAGCKVLCLTVDNPLNGIRNREESVRAPATIFQTLGVSVRAWPCGPKSCNRTPGLRPNS